MPQSIARQHAWALPRLPPPAVGASPADM